MSINYRDLNLTPSPYTSVVRIGIFTDERLAGLQVFFSDFSSGKDIVVVIRDKEMSDIYTVSVCLNAILVRLVLGRYQVLGLEANKSIRGDFANLFVLAARGPGQRKNSKMALLSLRYYSRI